MRVIQRTDGFFILRFDSGEQFPNQAFVDFLKSEAVKGAYFTGLGHALKVRLGYVDIRKKEYAFKTLEGMLEIATLTGEVSVRSTGELGIHTHLVISNEQLEAFAGHLDTLTVGATLEIFLWRVEALYRVPDERVGIEVLR